MWPSIISPFGEDTEQAPAAVYLQRRSNPLHESMIGDDLCRQPILTAARHTDPNGFAVPSSFKKKLGQKKTAWAEGARDCSSGGPILGPRRASPDHPWLPQRALQYTWQKLYIKNCSDRYPRTTEADQLRPQLHQQGASFQPGGRAPSSRRWRWHHHPRAPHKYIYSNLPETIWVNDTNASDMLEIWDILRADPTCARRVWWAAAAWQRTYNTPTTYIVRLWFNLMDQTKGLNSRWNVNNPCLADSDRVCEEGVVIRVLGLAALFKILNHRRAEAYNQHQYCACGWTGRETRSWARRRVC